MFANPGFYTLDIFVIGRIRSKTVFSFKDIILVTFSMRKAMYKETVCKRVKMRRGYCWELSICLSLLSHHFTFPETSQPWTKPTSHLIPYLCSPCLDAIFTKLDFYQSTYLPFAPFSDPTKVSSVSSWLHFRVIRVYILYIKSATIRLHSIPLSY